ncbi:hypothetical protein CR155_01780 [Pollutimonas nitritireducens]|uniref:diguanylate cyclase n=1 Tax=Pollutimonas nitritireducens TaxID=2045209 RepID=A0A2N4ULA2_9BURK|nr:GGDEF domain-containing protein [Pollutimonas nitritireducens]PLC55804.1 hypothetical protein CR155_01780 [Pollutimonas nitritireducens]
MSPVKEGPGIEVRANLLANKALAAQLRVLHAFVPLEGWLVGPCAEQSSLFATSGRFEILSSTDLASLFQGNWIPDPLNDGFFYRHVVEHEKQRLALDSTSGRGAAYLIRADLQAPDSESRGSAIGLAYDWPFSIARRTQEVRSCLTALALTLALHAELGLAERLMLELQRDAFLDPLTGTLNRAGWINRLAHIDAMTGNDGTDAAIFMLDLDYLKTVNDTQGHSAGDELIRLTAQTISAVLRNNDAVGRLGGDEFGIVAQYATPAGAAALMQRLKESFMKVGINISLGMALRSEAGSLKKTMHMADERMYEEKRTKTAPRRVTLTSQPTRVASYAAARSST